MAGYDECLRVSCELIRRHLEEGREIRPQDSIQGDLGLDSIAIMEFVSDIEQRFGINIPQDMYEQIVTVEDLARSVSKLSKGAAP
jgi:acyl carrier protein